MRPITMAFNGRTIFAFSVLLGSLIIAAFGLISFDKRETFSASALTSLWHDFKTSYIESSTNRTISNDTSDSTSSEDQALTMLRAVWMNDQETFDESWNWMRTYLKHKEDNLFASRYGKRPDGSYGIRAEDQGSASGADADTALALLFAYARWGQPIYQQTARQIMNDIWNLSVLTINNRPYLLVGSAEKAKERTTVLVSPSEFSPYALHIFAGIDSLHDWNSVLATSYELIQQSALHQLDKKKSAHIVPDFVLIDRMKGGIVPGPMPAGTTTDFSRLGARTAWRLALDWNWFQDERTKTALTNLELLGQEWRDNHRLAAVYSHDGKIVDNTEIGGMYGGTLGYFLITDPAVATQIRNEKIIEFYNEKENSFHEEVTSFDAMWMWLGLALQEGTLNNLLPPASVSDLHNQFIREPGL